MYVASKKSPRKASIHDLKATHNPVLTRSKIMVACPFSSPNKLFNDLADLRSKDGLVYSEILGSYVASRYDDIIQVLDQADIFSSSITVPDFPPPVKPIFAGKVPEKGTLLGWDNPDHDRLRKSVNSFFVPRRLERFQPMMVTMAHDLIDGFIAQGSVEIKSQFALPLPLKLIVTIAGLDPKRWEWIGKCLALFGGITEGAAASVQEKVKDVLDLHEYIADVIQERRTDRKDDLISHIWEQRDSGVVVMTDFEHLAMIPGLLLAGHETTTSVLTMGTSHLLHNNRWNEVNASDTTRVNAIEELVRYESAITGMRRLVTKDTHVGSQTLMKGDTVFLAYNSGSRDESVFPDSNSLCPGRKINKQHLGFGYGVHACLGAPLARLLLRTELAVLWERLPNLRLKTAYSEIEYSEVREGRGVQAVELAWDPPAQGPPMARSSELAQQISTATWKSIPQQDFQLDIQDLNFVADDVLEVTLCPRPDNTLPIWSAGAHIDVAVGDLGWRQYSLCSSPQDSDSWKIAVLREDDGLGGSKHLHKRSEIGETLRVRGPKNHFPFKPTKRQIFVAGGIGITPIKPMLEMAKTLGLDYRLIYLGRSRKTMAFVDDMCAEHPTTVWTSDQGQRFDLSQLVHDEQFRVGDVLSIYSCGPEQLLAGLEEVCAAVPAISLHIERFQASSSIKFRENNKAFEVVLAKSQRVLKVPADRSLLDVINENGGNVMSTCSKGTCGTCEVQVLAGQPEHRDSVLTAEEKLSNRSLMPCVSRCMGDRLVVDFW